MLCNKCCQPLHPPNVTLLCTSSTVIWLLSCRHGKSMRMRVCYETTSNGTVQHVIAWIAYHRTRQCRQGLSLHHNVPRSSLALQQPPTPSGSVGLDPLPNAPHQGHAPANQTNACTLIVQEAWIAGLRVWEYVVQGGRDEVHNSAPWHPKQLTSVPLLLGPTCTVIQTWQ